MFAILLAYVVQRKEWRGRGLVDFIAITPAAVPGIFFGIGYAMTFNQRWLDWLDRGAVIVISMIFWNIPVGYRAAIAGLQQIDRSIDEAATSLGASSLRAFGGVLFPIMGGPFMTGLVTAFVRAITTLSVVIFLFTPRHLDGHDPHLPAGQRLQLGRRDRVHGLRHRQRDRRSCSCCGASAADACVLNEIPNA